MTIVCYLIDFFFYNKVFDHDEW